MKHTANPPRLTIDMETRSACNLKATGTWRYSIDANTDVLCVAFRLPFWEPGRTALWAPAFPHLGIEEQFPEAEMTELVEWLAAGGLVESHNFWFEWCLWQNVLVPRYGWPPLVAENGRCSAAKAASYALPRGLDDAASALHLKIRKDVEGAKVMKKVRSPRKSLKKERDLWEKTGTTPPTILWHESRELFEVLWRYCRIDVLAEEAVSESLEDLNEHETELFLLDLVMNTRGFQLDQEAVETALRLVSHETDLLNRELSVVTNGYVDKATQRNNMKLWLASEGLELDDTQGATIDAYLAPECRVVLSASARRALELMRALGRSSTAKYQAMANWAGLDWRVRGGLLYHGASTGRWSGKGIQPHNFPKLSPKQLGQKDPTPEDIDKLWTALKTTERDNIIALYGGMMEALSAGLRGAIVAPPGKQLYVADFASIEARVLLWCAGDEDALDIFRNHQDIYCDMAASIYGRPVTKADKDERALGKVAILGLGYGMGAQKFFDTCCKFGIPVTMDLAEQTVAAYRQKYWRVKQHWYDQDASAIAAVESRSPVQCGVVRWVYNAPFLFCELPSGRRLAYMEPRIKMQMMPWGKEKKVLSFMGVDGYTRQWKRQPTYGGLLVENCLAEGTQVLTQRGWIAIEQVADSDLLWDGIDWVEHGGILDKGTQLTVVCDGVRMTPDHRVLTTGGWRDASSCDRHYRADVWLPDGVVLHGERREEIAVGAPLRVREHPLCRGERASQRASAVVRVQEVRDDICEPTDTRDVQAPSLCGVAVYERPLPSPDASGVAQLRRAWYQGLQAVARGFRRLLGRHGADVSPWADAGAQEQQSGVQPHQLRVGDADCAEPESTRHNSYRRDVSRRVCRQPGGIEVNSLLAAPSRTFDIRNCGPRHQFVVQNADGTRALVVHNCVQAVSRDLMSDGMLRVEATGVYRAVLTIHDEIMAEADLGAGSVTEFETLMSTIPEWASGCPVEAEGWCGPRYRK